MLPVLNSVMSDDGTLLKIMWESTEICISRISKELLILAKTITKLVKRGYKFKIRIGTDKENYKA